MNVGAIRSLHKFDYRDEYQHHLITVVHAFSHQTLLFGAFPSGIHVVDPRHPRGIVESGQLPKAPSATQATPLCIQSQSQRETEFLVCGRFPSVLLYDIRKGFGTFRSVYSGATSLSCLTIGSPDRAVAGGSYKGILHRALNLLSRFRSGNS